MIWTPFYNHPPCSGQYVCRSKADPDCEFFAWFHAPTKLWYLDSARTQALHPKAVDEWKYKVPQAA